MPYKSSSNLVINLRVCVTAYEHPRVTMCLCMTSYSSNPRSLSDTLTMLRLDCHLCKQERPYRRRVRECFSCQHRHDSEKALDEDTAGAASAAVLHGVLHDSLGDAKLPCRKVQWLSQPFLPCTACAAWTTAKSHIASCSTHIPRYCASRSCTAFACCCSSNPAGCQHERRGSTAALSGACAAAMLEALGRHARLRAQQFRKTIQRLSTPSRSEERKGPRS